MKKNITLIVLVILSVILAWFVFSPSAPTTLANQSHHDTQLSASGDITCTYLQVLRASYQGNEITHELPKPETKPIIMTFSGISKTPKVKFIDATKTISEVPIVKVLDTPEKLMFVEGDGDPYMTIHTIYKNTGIGIYEKSASLLGIPLGVIGMGSCIDY